MLLEPYSPSVLSLYGIFFKVCWLTQITGNTLALKEGEGGGVGLVMISKISKRPKELLFSDY